MKSCVLKVVTWGVVAIGVVPLAVPFSCAEKPDPFNGDVLSDSASEPGPATDSTGGPAEDSDPAVDSDGDTFTEMESDSQSEIESETDTDSTIKGSELRLELDESFGNDGELVYPSALGNDRAVDAVVTTDGSIFVTGYLSKGADSDLLLMKLNTDGTLDTSFNGTGVFAAHSVAGGNGHDAGDSINLAPDGDLLISGTSLGPKGYRYGVMGKVSVDGEYDISFGSSGVFLFDAGENITVFATKYDYTTGKIFAVCRVEGRIHAYRFLGDGSGLDKSFGDKGQLALGTSASVKPNLNVLDNGSVLVFGACLADGLLWDACAWQISMTGELVTGFTNYQNQALVHFGLAGGEGDDYWHAVIPYGGDRVILAGSGQSSAAGQDELVARVYLEDGSFDPSFGRGDGFWTEDVLGLGLLGRVRDAIVKQDGHVIAALEVVTDGGDFDVAVVKLDPDGVRDMTASSGRGGLLLGGSFEERRPSLIELPDGRLLVMTSTHNGFDDDVVLWAVH